MAAPVARGGDAESGAAPPTTVENATAPKTASTSGALMCCHGGLGPLRDRVWCQRIPAHAAALLALSAGLPSSSRWRTPTELKSSRSSESRAVTRGSMSMASQGTMDSDDLGKPAVLGELVVGILLGNLGLVGYHGLDALRTLPGIDILAQVGVLLLLFGVGLETSLQKMMAVGLSSLLVAALGVVAPMVLGFNVSAWFFPTHNPLTHWFVGATLCATSVGITARVLADLGRTGSQEGRIILGAAVIDDVLGLIVLAVVAGIIRATDRGVAFDPVSVLRIVGKSLVFLAGAVILGQWLAPGAFRVASRMRGEGLLLSVALAFCFGLALLAGAAGLAPIVGAFAAGLILDRAQYRELEARDARSRTIEELLQPIATFLVPVFFVLMGMRVDLSVFATRGVLGFAALLTLAAVIGKQACALGVLERGTDRLAVGLGMIP